MTGDRGDRQVECPAGIATVATRIRLRADDVEELHDRAGPAVGEDQRRRVRLILPLIRR
ncbi:hypothetical protein ACQPYK_48095 [Streptosporangium sp. CA-135522]|uniref:hypothetical protein n=1 Tax=Streptosporangium sp. CA-135522 TaxID=3240072 RepID=UPI003D8D95F3